MSTRRGYDSVLDSVLLPRFKEHPITAVNGGAASRLDLELTQKGGERKGKLSRSTRNNAQIVLRSVLRSRSRRRSPDCSRPSPRGRAMLTWR